MRAVHLAERIESVVRVAAVAGAFVVRLAFVEVVVRWVAEVDLDAVREVEHRVALPAEQGLEFPTLSLIRQLVEHHRPFADAGHVADVLD